MGSLQKSDIFHDIQFAVDFAATSQWTFKEKQEIRREIVDNGGILSYILTKQVGKYYNCKHSRDVVLDITGISLL